LQHKTAPLAIQHQHRHWQARERSIEEQVVCLHCPKLVADAIRLLQMRGHSVNPGRVLLRPRSHRRLPVKRTDSESDFAIMSHADRAATTNVHRPQDISIELGIQDGGVSTARR